MYTTLTSLRPVGLQAQGDTEVYTMPCTITSSPARASRHRSSAVGILSSTNVKLRGDKKNLSSSLANSPYKARVVFRVGFNFKLKTRTRSLLRLRTLSRWEHPNFCDNDITLKGN